MNEQNKSTLNHNGLNTFSHLRLVPKFTDNKANLICQAYNPIPHRIGIDHRHHHHHQHLQQYHYLFEEFKYSNERFESEERNLITSSTKNKSTKSPTSTITTLSTIATIETNKSFNGINGTRTNGGLDSIRNNRLISRMKDENWNYVFKTNEMIVTLDENEIENDLRDHLEHFHRQQHHQHPHLHHHHQHHHSYDDLKQQNRRTKQRQHHHQTNTKLNQNYLFSYQNELLEGEQFGFNPAQFSFPHHQKSFLPTSSSLTYQRITSVILDVNCKCSSQIVQTA